MLFLLGGIFLNILGFIYVAIGLYGVAVLFQFVTLPVEFDASRRAKRQLSGPRARRLEREHRGAGDLEGAAWTVRRRRSCASHLLHHLDAAATASAQRSRGIQPNRRKATTTPARPHASTIASAFGSAKNESPSR